MKPSLFRIAWLLAASCTGLLSGGIPQSTGPTPQNPLAPPSLPSECAPSAPGTSGLHRLSQTEYRNTVKDFTNRIGLPAVFESLQPALNSIPPDSTNVGPTDERVSGQHFSAYVSVARGIAEAAQANPQALVPLVGDCLQSAKLSPACAETTLSKVGPLAFRRPLTDAEIAGFAALVVDSQSTAENIRSLIVAVLLSPPFLLQLEINGAEKPGTPSVLQLDAFESASRLSYAFWKTAPDNTLFEAAASGALDTEAGYAAQVDRLLADPRAKEGYWSFWNSWLKFDSFTGFDTQRPGMKALAAGESLGEPGHEHYRDMVQEVRTLVERATFDKKQTFRDLLLTDESVTASSDLAKLYGVAPFTGVGAPPKFPPNTRAGLLHRAALLVSNLEQTNPFHRGATIRKSILCDDVASPDPNSLPPGSLDAPPVQADRSTRERFAAKVDNNPRCSGCHSQFSDIGYVMESFDALGRFRTAEKVFDEQTGMLLSEKSIDASATFRLDSQDTLSVSNAFELNQRLANSSKPAFCASKRLLRFALKRDLTTTGDRCVADSVAAALNDPNQGLFGAIRAVALDPTFRQRAGEF
jgi:hypothetical protein